MNIEKSVTNSLKKILDFRRNGVFKTNWQKCPKDLGRKSVNFI